MSKVLLVVGLSNGVVVALVEEDQAFLIAAGPVVESLAVGVVDEVVSPGMHDQKGLLVGGEFGLVVEMGQDFSAKLLVATSQIGGADAKEDAL